MHFENVTEKNIEEVVERRKLEVMNLLRQTIRPEFLNRVDEIIMFQPLMKKEIRGIIRIQLDNLSRMLRQNGIDLRFTNMPWITWQKMDMIPNLVQGH